MESKNKYETSKIYKIESHVGNNVYIGSTVSHIYQKDWKVIDRLINDGKMENVKK